jgi:hypothetical protein
MCEFCERKLDFVSDWVEQIKFLKSRALCYEQDLKEIRAEIERVRSQFRKKLRRGELK